LDICPAGSQPAGQEPATPIFDWASAARLTPRDISGRAQSPWDATRNPMLLFELFGLFLLRAAQRALF